jgi:hypothetical protein
MLTRITTTTVPDLPSLPNTDFLKFKHIIVKSLHPAFGAEVCGIEFSKPVDDDVFAEVFAAISKVKISKRWYLSR